MWQNRNLLLGKFQITFWNFPNSDLQETHFHAFCPHTSLLFWWIILNYIVLIFCLDCFIVLYLCFYILEWPVSKVYGTYMWMRLTHSQVKDSLSKILLSVCSTAEYYVFNFGRCHKSIFLLIVYKVFLSSVVFNCIYDREYFNITFY